jgi:creatinine amidohydrolase/Fe(II)-dependent formamide hydrolase-like protein
MRIRHSRRYSRYLAAAACAGLLAGPAAAQTVPAQVELEDLTWTEVRAAISAGSTTAIVPIGGTEQNGPAIALGKHNTRVRILSARIARELGNAIIAPVIAYVPEGRIEPPSSHMRFPGTISISDATFESLLEGAARSLKAAGFRDIVFLGDHGGYQQDIRQVVARLNREWGGAARCHLPAAYYEQSESGFAQWLRTQGYRDDEIGTHAGLADTSLQLALDPASVRADRLQQGRRFGAADGVYGGDPTRASAALGRTGADRIVAATVAAIRAQVGHPR